MTQRRARVTGKLTSGGGQRGQAGLYQLTLADRTTLLCDYIEIASDGFRFLNVGEEVWCQVDPSRPDWAMYVVPLREVTPRSLLGLPEPEQGVEDPVAHLWL